MKPEKQPLPAIYAVRIAGKDGWQIYNPLVTKDKIVAHLEGQGLKCLEFVEILTVLEERADGNELERMTVIDSMIMEKGWIYDSQRDYWLSPGEIYSEPDKQAVMVDSFDLVADPPEAGWWHNQVNPQASRDERTDGGGCPYRRSGIRSKIL